MEREGECVRACVCWLGRWRIIGGGWGGGEESDQHSAILYLRPDNPDSSFNISIAYFHKHTQTISQPKSLTLPKVTNGTSPQWPRASHVTTFILTLTMYTGCLMLLPPCTHCSTSFATFSYFLRFHDGLYE
jgi:hypothetical protein